MDTETGQNLSEPRLAGRGGTGMTDEIDLLDYIEVLVRRRWLIVWIVVLCALGSYGYFRSRPPTGGLFRAEANVLVPEGPGTDPASGKLYQAIPVNVNVLRRYSIGYNILERTVPRKMGNGADSVKVSHFFGGTNIRRMLKGLEAISDLSQDESGVITVQVTFANPLLATTLADAYVDELILYYSEKWEEQERMDLKLIESHLEAVEAELRAAEDSLLAFKRRHRGVRDAESIEELELQLSRFQRRVDIRSAHYANMLSRFEEARIQSDRRSPKLEVLNYAILENVTPVSRSIRQWVIISAGVGLIVSVFLAFFVDFLCRNRASGRMDPIVNELGKDVQRVRGIFR